MDWWERPSNFAVPPTRNTHENDSTTTSKFVLVLSYLSIKTSMKERVDKDMISLFCSVYREEIVISGSIVIDVLEQWS